MKWGEEIGKRFSLQGPSCSIIMLKGFEVSNCGYIISFNSTISYSSQSTSYQDLLSMTVLHNLQQAALMRVLEDDEVMTTFHRLRGSGMMSMTLERQNPRYLL